ncbi:hypothetical protein FQN57_000197 [Myotisia sp. PD_48]|nr:hypothetical protein FQN57_000197 [Myotisia sp. PD_48]
MSGSLFYDAIKEGSTHEVMIDQVMFVDFTDPDSKKAIGTANLNASTAVAVVSPFAAILADIAPLPRKTSDPFAGLQHVQNKMEEVISLYQMNIASFPPGKASIVVGARHNDALALPDHVDRVKEILEKNGIAYITEEYDVSLQGHATVAQGTVFIDAKRKNCFPLVYVEDRLVTM